MINKVKDGGTLGSRCITDNFCLLFEIGFECILFPIPQLHNFIQGLSYILSLLTKYLLFKLLNNYYKII